MNSPISSVTEESRLGRLWDGKLMARLWREARPHGRLALLALLPLPLLSLVQTAQPLVLRLAVDHHLISGRMEGFATLVWLFALLMALQFLFQFLQSLVNGMLGQRIVRDLRQALFDRLLTLDAAYFAHHQTGRLTNRLTNDVEAVSQMVGAGAINLLSDFLLLAGLATGMFFLSPALSLIALGIFPLVAAGVFVAARKVRHSARQGQLIQGRMAHALTEELQGHAVVRLFHRQEKNRQRFDRLNRDSLDAALAGNFWEALQVSYVETLSVLTVAALFVAGAVASEEPAWSLGVLVAFIEYIRRLFLPIRDLASKFTTMQAAMTALERIFALLDTAPAMVSPPVGPMLADPASLRLEGVSFDYGQGAVLNGIDLTLHPGERIALVGPTGAGKSTLAKLLNRTMDPVRGRVTLGGVDLREIPLPLLRRRVGMVAQETFLFSGTIADNIALGDPTLSRARIRDALERVGAWSFVARLPDGLDAHLAERGANLSQGQRQLLGMARAWAFDPPILILDEATSAMDSVTERLLQEALSTLLAGRASLVIAHRLSTVIHSHRILVLAHGRIAEEGDHARLLAQNGLYARLCRLQFREPGEACVATTAADGL